MAILETSIETGRVRGRICGGLRCAVFCGIPYAAPTSGNNRFRLPQHPEPWDGIRDCTQFGEICIQDKPVEGLMPFTDFFIREFYPYNWPMGENSLVLNIWTPAEDPAEKLPVMFWIHGGGMGSGYGHEMEFDGEAIASRGCVLVTINYRVSFLAWLAHPDLTKENPDGISGNLGLYDQNFAMQWVRRNISAFGGDPDNVTIFGQSAGGGSVTNHLILPMSKGLFHKAIIQSGSRGAATLGSRYGDSDSHDCIDMEAGERWGVNALNHIGKTIDQLREMDGLECYKLLEKAQQELGPCPRQHYSSVFTNAAQAFYSGRSWDVPVMVGSVSGDDSLFSMNQKPGDFLEESLPGVNKEFFERYPLEGEGGEIENALRATHNSNDFSIGCARELCGQGATYTYYMNPYIPETNGIPFVPDGEAYHSVELWYIFGTLNRCWRRFDGRHYDLSRAVTDYWTNFARSGDPNGNGLPYWPRFTMAGGETQILNERGIRTENRMNERLLAYYNFLYEVSNRN